MSIFSSIKILCCTVFYILNHLISQKKLNLVMLLTSLEPILAVFFITCLTLCWQVVFCIQMLSLHGIYQVSNLIKYMYAPIYFKVQIQESQISRSFTSEIKHLLNCLRSLCKRYKTHPTKNNLNCLKSAESHQSSINCYWYILILCKHCIFVG